MHCIAQEEQIVFYNLETRWSMVKTRRDWIKYLAQTLFSSAPFYGWYRNRVDPKLMDYIQMTGNDLRAVPYFVGNRLMYDYTLRPYLFYEQRSGRIVDPRLWMPEIMMEHCVSYSVWKRDWYPLLSIYASVEYPPGFRREPVPGCGKKKKKYRHFLRHMSAMNERRTNSDPDIFLFVRAARRPHALPTVYDDIPRHNSRSWKRQGKYRHQWEKNLD